jgi:2-polyprenyl-3-methyl-5-hydroxy-6-metoxy-1,4-benzoquinol methylase
MNPRIIYEKVIELYENDQVSVSISTSPVQKDIDRIKYKYGLILVDQIKPPSKEKILDLGCGVGVSLEVAGHLGWEQSVGVDVNEAYLEAYDSSIKGVQFINSNFDEINPSKLGCDFDCVTMWNVLEHIYDLNDIMIKLGKLLKPGALLLVLVPNIESLALRLFREKGSTIGWPHVSHFSIKSLRYLMGKHYFKEELVETVITEIDNIKSYMSGEYPYHGYGDPDSLFDFITPEYIHRNFLGSRILAIFRKT